MARLPALLLLALVLPGLAAAQPIQRRTDAAAEALLQRGGALAQPAQQAARQALARACAGANPQRWPGLELREGRVVAAELLREVEGFAAEANTAGGLGGRLYIVTTLADNAHNEPVLLGSLRYGIEQARRDKAPLWIVFAPNLGPDARLRLKQDIRPPDNVTIDGGCAEVTLETEVDIGCILMAETRNVVLTRLGCRTRDYSPEAGDGDHARSGFRLNGSVDRIAILHNDLSQCGDGCMDITISPNRPLPGTPGRITFAFNRVADHNKVMLFGPINCGQAPLPPATPPMARPC